MDENSSDEVADTGGGSQKWMYAGGAALLAGIAGYGVAQIGGDPEWSTRAGEAGAATSEAVSPLPAIAVEPADVAEEEPVRGVIQPKTQSTVSSKLTARITSMPFQVGQSFRRGALLASFDCSPTVAQLRAAEAAAAAYKLEFETNQELDAYEAIGTNEVAISEANLGRANAEARAIRAELSDCKLYSTFSGTVVEKLANRGEIAASGQPLMKIQSGGDLEVELIVASDWLTWLEPGAPFRFVIDETGNEVSGTIRRLGASVDPVSKTIRVTGAITEQEGLVLPGMSGTAEIDRPEETTKTPSDDQETSAESASGD
ncbi:MAG: efflux RND transporter periplasmic adaptor subunit [Pseudomonadota bacterium]